MWLTAACMALVMAGCISSHQSFVVDTSDREWSEAVSVVIPNSDTISLRDLRITLRHDGDFRGEKVEVTITTMRPDSLLFSEPMVLHLSDDGRSESALHDVVCEYRRDVLFDMVGDYRMVITPMKPQQGILAVGVDIVKSE